MLDWGNTSIVYSPIYTKILFDRDFLGSEGSKFSAGSKFFDTPCSTHPKGCAIDRTPDGVVTLL